MTFFERILKKRLGEGTSATGIAPDDLWAAIEQGLPPEEVKTVPFNLTRLLVGLLGLLLALIVSLSLLLTDESTERPVVVAAERTITDDIPEFQEETVLGDLKADEVTSKGDDALNSANEMSPSFPAELAEQKLTKINQAKNEPSIKIEDPVKINWGPAKTNEPVGRAVKAVTNAPAAEIPGSKNYAAKERTPTVAADMVNTMAAGQPAAIRSERAATKLNQARSISNPVGNLAEVALESFTTIRPVRQLQRPRIELGVFVGTNLLRHKYPSAASDDLADVLNTSRGEALGQSAALEIGYRLRPGLRVSTGVELLKTHTTFRYTEQWDTVTLRNGREVAAIAIRRVENNNRQTLLSLPLLLEKSFATGRWEAGLAAGVSLNFLLKQSGRSLNALKEVVTYSSGDDENLPVPDFFLSYQVRPFLNYRLNNQVSIQARADLRWQQYGKSALYDFSAQSVTYGGSVGVVFGL